ncbi:MAG TPA: twin-arginine translocase subunit TatC [Opitutaceae bacterium]|nr:twin-arginine translocase subunit TatC [Opitutaceae bacterium]
MDEIIEVEPSATHGAAKSFWAHLEDLRKAIIRSAIAIGLGLMLCMTFTDRLVAILEYPLRRIDLFEKPQPTVTLKIGDTQLGPFSVRREEFAGLPPGAAPHAVFQIGSAVVGREQVATLKLLPSDAAAPSPLRVRLHNLGPAEGFFIAFHVAFYGALIVSSPFWIYFLGVFVMPALHLHERRVIFQWLGWSLLLFLVGVAMTYFLLLPVALRASLEYSNLLGFDAYDWKADDYISFVTHFLFGMGLGFQFPVVVLFLVRIGILTHAHLAKYRRHVCVLSFILGAVLTTPEVITQVAMAIPLYLLYEICIWIAWYWEWKKRRAAAAAGGA